MKTLFRKVPYTAYPARFPTLSSAFFLFSLFINDGVQMARSGTFPWDQDGALVALYAFVLVGLIPFVFSGGVALMSRSFLNKPFRSLFDKILVRVNGILGLLLLISAALMMSR